MGREERGRRERKEGKEGDLEKGKMVKLCCAAFLPISSVILQVAIFAEGFFAFVLNIVIAPSWSRVYNKSKHSANIMTD